MKRTATIAIAVALAVMFALGNVPGHVVMHQAEEETSSDSALVDMVADLIEKRGKQDSTIYLIGNVIFHHNGAIIQCDSARKYSSNSMDFFGHVIVNKDSAYIYGDKASYDGRTSLAKVFAPIVKLMRGDASLYTYNLTFNTKTNIGHFDGGGMMIHRDTNHMESMSGDFYADNNELVFRENVSLRNPSYTAKSDSLKYNLDEGVITFMTRTTIWTNEKNDILKASSGNILTDNSVCRFTKDSYVLSSSYEMWADTLSYDTKTKRVTMFSNIQLVDTVHRTIGFGDRGMWDDSLDYAVLTGKPSIRSYSSDRTDTMYLRADSIIMEIDDSTATVEDDGLETPDMPHKDNPTDSVAAQDSTAVPAVPEKAEEAAEVPVVPVDSTAADSTAVQAADSTVAVPAADSVKMRPPLIADTTVVDSLMKDIAEDTVAIVPQDTVKQTPRVVRGFRDARGWNREYQFRCDSLVSHTKDSMGTMYGKPVLWNENNELIAEQIDLYTFNGDLDWADLTGDPIIIQKIRPRHPVLEDSTRFNQAAGTTMQTYFKNNELDSATMQGNVHNVYWMDHKGFTAALADITCADLTIFFKDRNLTRLRWNGNVDWKIYPLEKIEPKQPRFLEKFEWLDEIRPKSPEDISDRTIRPSMRETVSKEEKPVFRIENGILYKMRQLMEEGRWSDRTEETSVTPDYFLTR